VLGSQVCPLHLAPSLEFSYWDITKSCSTLLNLNSHTFQGTVHYSFVWGLCGEKVYLIHLMHPRSSTMLGVFLGIKQWMLRKE
jgi:hypothetical protein